MNLKISKGKLSGNISVISSKSYGHRYLIASSLSKTTTTINDLYLSDDVTATLNCLKNFNISYTNNDSKLILNTNNDVITDPFFNASESGSTLRFMIPVSLTRFNKVKFIGSKRLFTRGLSVYEDIFKEQGIKYTIGESFIEIEGKLKSGTYNIPGNISSQYITGLLFSLPLLDGDSVINITSELESKPYIDLTLKVLKEFGIEIIFNDKVIYIKGNQKYISSGNYTIEGDYSNAAFLDAFNYFGSNIYINNLNSNSLQGDKVYKEYFNKLSKGYTTLDIKNCIDLGPVLFVFSSMFFGAKFTGIKRLIIKESNRIESIVNELSKIGIKCTYTDEEITIDTSNRHNPSSSFNTYNDHRIAMALSILSSYYDIEIMDYEVVKKSYPNYFLVLEELGAKIIYEK